MMRTITALVFIGLAIAGVWQLVDPFLPLAPSLVGTALLILGLVAGMRIGSESNHRFCQDLMRHSRLLAEQNRDLVELNQTLLHEAGAPEPPKLTDTT